MLDGVFYELEIQKVEKTDDVYQIDHTVKKRKRKGEVKYFVKWKGYPSLRSGSNWVGGKRVLGKRRDQEGGGEGEKERQATQARDTQTSLIPEFSILSVLKRL